MRAFLLVLLAASVIAAAPVAVANPSLGLDCQPWCAEAVADGMAEFLLGPEPSSCRPYCAL